MGHTLNNVKAAPAHRAGILDNNMREEKADAGEIYHTRECVKTVHKITQKQILLTPVEKNEVVTKYESGMSMTALAKLYGCHRTTVGRILKDRGVDIRD